jgi:uncharacterized protein YjiS (DUF1127 family)
MPTATGHRTISGFFPNFPPDWSCRAPSALWLWLDRQRQRAALAALDDRLLDDIGVSRDAAQAEWSRWD